MGALNVSSFGGVLFGVNKRDLPDNGAQIASNMQTRVGSFAPLNEDGAPFNLSAVGAGGIGLGTVVAGTTVRTMFRYPHKNTGSTTVLGSEKRLSIVKGALVNDTRERCYLADDGSVGTQLPPHVLYGGASASARLLGVPAPNTELAYTVNPVAQLTAEHLANVQAENEAVILQKFEAMLRNTWGGTPASASRPGYMDNGAATDAAATGFVMQGDKPNQSRIFGIDCAGLTFSALSADYFSWALGVPFTTHTFSSSNASALTSGWGGVASGVTTGGNFAAFTYKSFYPVFALGSDTEANAARASILAIKQPGMGATDFILTAPQLTELEGRVANLFTSSNPDVAAFIGRINFRYLLLTQLMDGKIGSTALNKLNTWLGSDTAVQARINAAYDAFASAVWEKLNTALTTPENANATYTGTSYPAGALAFFASSTAKSYVMPLIVTVAKAMLTGDGTPSSPSDNSQAVAPYIAVRPISRLKTFLDGEKLSLYTFAPTASQDAVFKAAQILDFMPELRALYNDTTMEAMADLADAPALFVQGGESTAAAVLGARDALELEIGNLEAYYAGVPEAVRQIVKWYLIEKGIGDLHGEIDPSGAQLFDTRYYTWTYVNDWGEESQDWAHWAGALPTAQEIDQNDTVTLTRTGTVPAWHGTISHWRIYRSNTASNTRYQLVAEVPIANTSFTDDLKADRLQETLSTDIWSMPPTQLVGSTTMYLQGLVNMPNNFLAGFIDSTVYFSEIAAPYAWPIDYSMPVSNRVVGMEVFGQTLVVLTEAGPFYISGSDPSSMSKTDSQSNEACLSKQSIARVDGGVVFASQNGLCLANGSGVSVFLPAPLGKMYWAVMRPDLIQCAEFDGVLYFAAGPIVNDASGEWQALYGLNLSTMKITSIDAKVTSLYNDRTTDSLYIALPHNGAIPTAVNAMAGSGYRTSTWRSKRITLPKPESFAWLQVMGEQRTQTGYGATVKLIGYAVKSDGTEIAQTLAEFTVTNVNPVRVRPGRFLEFEVEVSSKAQIKNVIFANAIDDLQGVT